MTVRPRRLAFASTAVLAALAVSSAGAAPTNSGLSITPQVFEHAAAAGGVGSVTISNFTGQAMKISVTAHPWLQGASGAVVPNQRATLSGLLLSRTSFTLPDDGSQSVSLALAHVPASGSLYGNFDVIGVPSHPSRKRNAVTVEYRLIGSLRLDPVHATLRAVVGAAIVRGTHAHGSISLPVRNAGNTVDPIGGSIQLHGPRGALSGTIAPARILPGATVDLPVSALNGSVPAGSYTLSVSLKQDGRRVLSASRRVTLH